MPGFIQGAKEGLVPDENGKEFLEIVEAGDGNRHEHYLENGSVSSIHNVLFALNRETPGAINIFTTDSTYTILSPFEGNFMRMADQFQGELIKDSLQMLQLRSLYNVGGMEFVIPKQLQRGSYGVIQVPREEYTEGMQDALILDISSGGRICSGQTPGRKGFG